MPRILFTKTGDAVWISHLDLMRLFQRAFKRAGLPLTHTQGYNPRPSVSIALPLSVGVESVCELLDFDLEGETVPCDEITCRLNDVLVPGIRVLETYDNGI
jgi:radical SAM-linked protein